MKCRPESASYRRCIWAAAWCAAALLTLALGGARIGHAAPLRKPGVASACDIALHDGTLTAWIDAAPLRQVLDQLHTLSGVTAMVSPAESEERVTVSISGLPMDQAVRMLLHGENFAVAYAAGTRGERVATIWVFPKGTAPPAASTRFPSSAGAVGAGLIQPAGLQGTEDGDRHGDDNAHAHADLDTHQQPEGDRHEDGNRHGDGNAHAHADQDADPQTRRPTTTATATATATPTHTATKDAAEQADLES